MCFTAQLRNISASDICYAASGVTFIPSPCTVSSQRPWAMVWHVAELLTCCWGIRWHQNCLSHNFQKGESSLELSAMWMRNRINSQRLEDWIKLAFFKVCDVTVYSFPLFPTEFFRTWSAIFVAKGKFKWSWIFSSLCTFGTSMTEQGCAYTL